MGKLVKTIGAGLGLGGGASEARQYGSDPAAFSDLYEKGVTELSKVGTDQASTTQRNAINRALQDQLGGLDANAAGRKENFLEDQSRAFAADTQNLARARGGTGTLAQVLRPSGEMYDAQARATSRGLNDLYSQATQDLGSLSNIYGGLQSQDLDKSSAIANVYGGELASRRGTQAQNKANEYGAQQAQYDRLAGTIKGGAKLAAGAPA